MTDVRARIEHASRINLVDKGMHWPENHLQLADWVLALDGITVVERSALEPLRAALWAFDEYAPTTFADYHGVAGVINTARALLAAADAAAK